MMLFGSDFLYIGIDQECFWDFWREGAASHVHMGTLRLEWDCRTRQLGPIQKSTDRSNDRATAQGHSTLSST